MTTLVCAHGTAILTDRGPSELVPSEARYLLGLESCSMASGRIFRMHQCQIMIHMYDWRENPKNIMGIDYVRETSVQSVGIMTR